MLASLVSTLPSHPRGLSPYSCQIAALQEEATLRITGIDAVVKVSIASALTGGAEAGPSTTSGKIALALEERRGWDSESAQSRRMEKGVES